MASRNLGDIVVNVPEFKAQWLALQGTFTYAKSNLTRKMNEEFALAKQTKPSAEPGPELQVPFITFNSNYGSFLKKSRFVCKLLSQHVMRCWHFCHCPA